LDDKDKPEGTENEAIEQIAFADRILLNKTDLVSESDIDRIISRIKSINAIAPIIPCQYGKINLDEILNVKGFDLSRVLEKEPEFLTDQEHQHDLTVTSVGVSSEAPLNFEKFQTWIRMLLRDKGVDLFRTKGVIFFQGKDKRFVLQAVHMLFDGNFDREWNGSVADSKLIFIGRNLNRDELEQGFMSCQA
jgi:G3E family GTPase